MFFRMICCGGCWMTALRSVLTNSLWLLAKDPLKCTGMTPRVESLSSSTLRMLPSLDGPSLTSFGLPWELT